jgi:hypothetical protein
MFKIKYFIFVTIFCVPMLSFSETDIVEAGAEKIQEATDKVQEVFTGTRLRRIQTDYFAILNYSYLDLIIPSKIGLTLGLKKSTDKTMEFEFLRGKFAVPLGITDLGSMTDDRYSFIVRSYIAENSFNVSYGISYFDYSIKLGSDLMNSVNQSYPSVNMVKMQSLGFNLGIGNRWIIEKNITLGIDWISWSQPLISLKRESAFLDYSNNANDRKNVDNAMKVISYFPRFAALKLQLGISF